MSTNAPLAELNDALRKAGYSGSLYPESDLAEEYSDEEMQDYEDRTRRALEEIREAFQVDPDLKRRSRRALGRTSRVSKACCSVSRERG